LFALGLTPSDFSSYSYRNNDDLYLEEDADATKFIVAYRQATGNDPKYRERGAGERQSRIRSYARNM
jgi:hypothetical protein